MFYLLLRLSPNYTFPNREPNELRIVSRGESGWIGVSRSRVWVVRGEPQQVRGESG